MVEANLGLWDRVLRGAVGLAMLCLGWLADGGSWTLALRVFAFYPLITGLVGWSPLYALLRIKTRRS